MTNFSEPFTKDDVRQIFKTPPPFDWEVNDVFIIFDGIVDALDVAPYIRDDFVLCQEFTRTRRMNLESPYEDLLDPKIAIFTRKEIP